MRARPSLTIAAAVILVFCRTAADRGEATVIRDGKTLNPAVEAGGHKLSPAATGGGQAFPVPYSLIGALRGDFQWCQPFIVWPWRSFAPIDWNNHARFGRISGEPLGTRPFPGHLIHRGGAAP